jgi:toxin HigB-1
VYRDTLHGVISTFRSKALRDFWKDDDASGINAKWRAKIARILDVLDAAAEPVDLVLPGLHALKGNRKGTFAATVTRNWRITFAWRDGLIVDVDLEDYHGK